MNKKNRISQVVKLSIIIINYNVKYFLEQCLASVMAAALNSNVEIFVVDNCSADGSIEYLQSKLTSVKFITNEQNMGFAKANNIALKKATGDYVLFLNPDTIVPENTFNNCIDFFETNENAGAVGVRMIDGGGCFLPESKRSFPSPLIALYKLVGLSALFPRSKMFGQYALGFLDEKEIHEVDVLAGAFIICRKKVLEVCGGFDEDFFMYGEDIDLSYRIQKAGYKNYYLGNNTIVHFKGESAKKGSLNYLRMFYGAMILFVKKHCHGIGAWLMRGALQVVIFIRMMIAIVVKPFNALKQLLHKTIKQKQSNKIILVGDKIAAENAIKIIESSLNQTAFTILPSVLEAEKEMQGADEMVFCTGSLTYHQSIDLLQQIPENIYAKWFGSNTQSIVGSNHKNKNGEVYVSIHT